MSIAHVISSIVTQKKMKNDFQYFFCKSILSHTLWKKKSIHAITHKNIYYNTKKIRVELLKFL